MKSTIHATRTLLSTAVALGCSSQLMAAEGGFIEDATATLQARNYYFSRDYSDIVGANRQSKAEEWAQGFILNAKSGYTQGTIGVGVDVIGLLGLKLDSSPDRVNTGLLPVQSDGRAADDYSRVEGTLKLRYSKTELRVGELQPNLPVLVFSDIRLLPPSYQGASITSGEINGLTLQGGHLTSTHLRNEAGDEKMQAMLSYVPQRQASSDAFNYGGGDYAFNDKHTSVSAWYGQLEDIYHQGFLGLKHSQPLGSWTLGRRTSAISMPGRMARSCWAISTTRRSSPCCRPSTAAIPSTSAIRACLVKARSLGYLPTSRRWATKCRPMNLPLPTSAPGRRATTTTLPPSACRA